LYPFSRHAHRAVVPWSELVVPYQNRNTGSNNINLKHIIVTSNPLESARAKLDRANYHLEQLKRELWEGKGAYGFRFLYERSGEEMDLVVYALIPRDLFVHFSIIAGEIISHARSALEHAVWEMVPVPKQGVTGFPVFRVESGVKNRDYNSRGVAMIDGINPAAGDNH
jgi:hypothetical protein